MLADSLGINAPHSLLYQLQTKIEEELQSLTLFSDVIPTLSRLESLGIQIGICSNLAQPYGVVIDRLLSKFDAHKFLSYEIGYIKPDPEMYRHILDHTGWHSGNCLFIGDTFLTDYEGPTNSGFKARHLIRGENAKGYVIGGLSDIFLI